MKIQRIKKKKKILVMNKLVEAGVVSEILKLNKKKKITPKDIKDIRKEKFWKIMAYQLISLEMKKKKR